MVDKRIADLVEITAAQITSDDDVRWGLDKLDQQPEVSRQISGAELKKYLDTSIVVGVLPLPTTNRTIDFNSQLLTFENLPRLSTDGTIEPSSLVLADGGNTIDVSAPTPLTESYGLELWPALPTAQQVANKENFVTIDENGSLGFDDAGATFTDTNITTGVVQDAVANRLIGFGNNSLQLYSMSAFDATDNAGTSINYLGGDITLLAAQNVHLQPTAGVVDAKNTEVHTLSVDIFQGANSIKIAPPATLTSSYTLNPFVTLPNAGEVSADQNYVRVDENGQLTYSAAVGTGQGTDLSIGNRTNTTMEVVSSTGDNVDLLPASSTQAGLVTSTQHDLIETIPNLNTDLSIGNRTATIMEVVSSTGNNVNLLQASGTQAGLVTSTQHDLIETIPSLPTEDTSIVAGTLPPAADVRNINLNSNNLNFINVATVNFDGPIVSTSSITQTTANLAANANTVGQTAPAGLASSYSVEWLDALPSAGDVSSDANFLRISDAGKLTFTNVPMTTDTSLTIGTLATAVDDRTANFGGNSLNLINTSQITMASAGIVTVSAPTINASSATVRNAANELVEGGQSVTLLPPTPATVSYSIEMFDGLPTTQQVADDENFLRIDATGKLLFTPTPGGGPIGGTNLSLINRNASTYTVASDTGSNAELLQATPTLAGLVTAAQHNLIETIPSLPTEDTSLTSGAIPDAAENRTINFAGFNWVTNNVANMQITATNAAITNGSGTALNITGTDVRLDAQGVINCTADVDASGVTVSTQQLNVKASGNANTVNLTAPAALAAGYGLEYFDALPSAGDVTNSLNYVRVDNLGKLYLGAAGTGPGATTIWETVSNKAARTSAPVVVGYFSFVQSNQVKYVWDGLAYQIDAAEAVGTTAERNALTEVEDKMLFTDINDNRVYRYDSAEDPPWIQVG